jgi:hypothetical protein
VCFTAAKRRSSVKALRKRDVRNAQALRLAHVAAGKGVGADHLTPHGGRKLHPRGNPLGLPHQNLKLWGNAQVVI